MLVILIGIIIILLLGFWITLDGAMKGNVFQGVFGFVILAILFVSCLLLSIFGLSQYM